MQEFWHNVPAEDERSVSAPRTAQMIDSPHKELQVPKQTPEGTQVIVITNKHIYLSVADVGGWFSRASKTSDFLKTHIQH